MPEETAEETALAKYKEEGCNIILGVGAGERISPLYETRLFPLRIDANPLSGEVHYMGTKTWDSKTVRQFMLSRSTIDSIGTVMGVSWSAKESIRLDDRSDRKYCSKRAVGYVRRADGTIRRIVGEKAMSIEDLEEEARDEQWVKMQKDGWKLPKKYSYMEGSDDKKILEFLVHREVLQKQRNIEQLCETGARLRALRSLGIKSTYTDEDFAQPFILGCVVYSPDRSDKDIEAWAKERVRKDIDDLYGTQAPPEDVHFTDVGEGVEDPDRTDPGTATETRAEEGAVEESAPSGEPQPELAGKEDYSKVAMLASSEHITDAEEEKMLERLAEGGLTRVVTEGFIKKLKDLIAERTEIERKQANLEI